MSSGGSIRMVGLGCSCCRRRCCALLFPRRRIRESGSRSSFLLSHIRLPLLEEPKETHPRGHETDLLIMRCYYILDMRHHLRRTARGQTWLAPGTYKFISSKYCYEIRTEGAAIALWAYAEAQCWGHPREQRRCAL